MICHAKVLIVEHINRCSEFTDQALYEAKQNGRDQFTVRRAVLDEATKLLMVSLKTLMLKAFGPT